MRTRKDLRKSQRLAIKLMDLNPMFGLLVDMGLGKTIMVLTSFVDSIAMLTGRASETCQAMLVVGPKRVVETVWDAEAKEWQHTKRLKFSRIMGSAKERLNAIHTQADIYLMNVDNVPWLATALFTMQQQKRRLPFNRLVVDESSGYKDRSTRRFRGMSAMLPAFSSRNILTGTPSPNSLLDLWPQIFLLDQCESLGNYETFSTRYFEMSEETGRREPKPDAIQSIYREISHLVLRLDNKDIEGMPAVVEMEAHFSLPPEARRVYDRIEAEMFVRLDEVYAEIAASIAETGKARAMIEAVNAAVLTGKCHQIANGAVFDSEHRDIWHTVHNARLDTLKELLAEISTPVMIAYTYRHDRERLLKMLPNARYIGGGNKDTQEIVDLWNDDKIQHLLIHPRSGSHGLNMQKGSGHTIVFFSNTWSLEMYDQLIARLARSGQAKESVTIIRMMADDTIDHAMIDRLTMRGSQQKFGLDYLRDYQLQRQGA